MGETGKNRRPAPTRGVMDELAERLRGLLDELDRVLNPNGSGRRRARVPVPVPVPVRRDPYRR